MRPSLKNFELGIYINSNTKAKIVWNRIRKITGKIKAFH